MKRKFIPKVEKDDFWYKFKQVYVQVLGFLLGHLAGWGT